MSVDMYLRISEDQASKVEKTSKDLTDKYDDLKMRYPNSLTKVN